LAVFKYFMAEAPSDTQPDLATRILRKQRARKSYNHALKIAAHLHSLLTNDFYSRGIQWRMDALS
jgi:hypothetical protein